MAVLLLASVLSAATAVATGPDPTAALDLAMSRAEASLQAGDLPAAQAHYRDALFEGWLTMATLERLDGRRPEAREALTRASQSAAGDRQAVQSIASAWLQMGEAATAADLLATLAARDPRDVESRRLLAKALAARGQPERAVKMLDEAAAAAGDPEMWFLLGTEYLWLREVGAADRLFTRALEGRPVPQLHVLVGRAYRDAGEYARARAHFHAALEQDARVRHAHYYLGMVTLADPASGPDRLERAIAEFREEVRLAPEDGPANHQLGAALLESGQAVDALPHLQAAARADARFLYVYELGRGLLALDRVADAASTFRRALGLAQEQGAKAGDLGKIHYQLGLVLRKLGSAAESATHLAEARRLAAVDDAGEGAIGGSSGEVPSGTGAPSSVEVSPLAEVPAPERGELKGRVRVALARSYLNLGVMEAQHERFREAAESFEKAAAVDPDFPQVQSSLGIAYFNARQFDKATAPLARAVASSPGERGLKRMLALAWLNTEAYGKAAELLGDDPDREKDPSLALAYSLALVALEPGNAGAHYQLGLAYQKLGQTDRAEQEFARSRALKAPPR